MLKPERKVDKQALYAELKKNGQEKDIEIEKKLIGLLGFDVIESDSPNRWRIVDKTHSVVGHIQYKALFGKNKKKNTPAVFGYDTRIFASYIDYTSRRKEDNNCIDSYVYEMKVDEGNGQKATVQMTLGAFPSIMIWSKTYGFMSFKIDYEGLYLNYKTKTETFNVEEVLSYKTDGQEESPRQREYVYQISYSKAIKDNMRGISAKSELHQRRAGQMSLEEYSWKEEKCIMRRTSTVAGTVEDLAAKNKMGLEMFDHFRDRMNELLPFKEDIMAILFERVENRAFDIFVPDLEPAKKITFTD